LAKRDKSLTAHYNRAAVLLAPDAYGAEGGALPPYTSIQSYINAINSGQTNITTVLTQLMQNPAQWQSNVSDIRVDPHVSDWLRQLFLSNGMTEAEVDHIDTEWPMNDKRTLRLHVLRAIQVGRKMSFEWVPGTDPAPSTKVKWPADDKPPEDPITVTFVQQAGAATLSADQTEVTITSSVPGFAEGNSENGT
jgi:hypothetical protein